MPTISLQSLRQIKPETLHTTPVLADQVAARGLGVFGGGEQHALVARGLFLFADAAGLGLSESGSRMFRRVERRFTFTLVAPSLPGGLVSAARLLICADALPMNGIRARMIW